MKNHLTTVIRTSSFLILFSLVISCDQPVAYLDSDFPGLEPKKYGVGLINREGLFQQNLTMSPDGREHFFTQTDSALWRYERILRVRSEGSEYVIDTPRFVTDFQYENEWFIGEPMLSPDDQTLYFVADYPPDLWAIERHTSGDWSKPTKMGISTEKDDWYVTIANSGNLYFTNGTVYQSNLADGQYLEIQPLTASFNAKDIRDPLIAPKEDYLLFSHEGPDGFGQADLYVSFRQGEDWTEPQNLGAAINTESIEFGPSLSPDERFLFFSRRDQWQNATFSDIYWVSLEVIDPFRPVD